MSKGPGTVAYSTAQRSATRLVGRSVPNPRTNRHAIDAIDDCGTKRPLAGDAVHRFVTCQQHTDAKQRTVIVSAPNDLEANRSAPGVRKQG